MAEYKDILLGTLKNLGVRLSDAVKSSGIKEIYENGAARVKDYSRITKLTLDVNGDSEELRRVYTEIGRLYYETCKKPEGFFEALFSRAKDISDRIDRNEAEIAELKELYGEDADGIDVEITELPDDEENLSADGTDENTEE